jgi:sirohydrochlorin ferrochelatase
VTKDPVLVAAAHGTRDPKGPAVLGSLLDRVRERLPAIDVRVAYVDVIEPTLRSVLASVDGPAVVVPLFLASGYHVRVDVPDAVAATGGSAVVTPALGPDPAVIDAVADRLRAVLAGDPADAVVLAAAGSSDRRALGEVGLAAERLGDVLAVLVRPGYVATATPSVADTVAGFRAQGHGRVALASYLLAPGLFQRRLADAGADVVADPIGLHPRVVDLIAKRYRSALPR